MEFFYGCTDSFLSIFSKFWSNWKFAESAGKIELFQYFELILRTFYVDLKKVFDSENLSIQLQLIFCCKLTRMNPCSGGLFLIFDIEMSLHRLKQVPKWRYLVEISFIISQQQKLFLIGQINSLKSCFVLCQLLRWTE